MSLILDALRKSERTRQQSLTGQLGAGETPVGTGRLPVPWVPLLAAILVVNALLFVFFWPRSEAPVATPAPVVQAAPVAAYQPEVRPLSQEAPGDAVASATPPVTISPAPASIGNPAPATPAVRAYGNQPAVQSMDSLPADIRQALPALHLDVHAYAKDPADRFVVINLQRYRVGDVLTEGPKLVDILPQGAVLEFRGTTFLLPAS